MIISASNIEKYILNERYSRLLIEYGFVICIFRDYNLHNGVKGE